MDQWKQSATLLGESFVDDDAQLALTSASRAIDRATNRRFWKDTDASSVRLYRPWSCELLEIDDLVALTSFTADQDGDGVYETTYTVDTDFRLYPLNAVADGVPFTQIRRIRGDSGFVSGSIVFGANEAGLVKLTGQFGWAAVPAEIEQATMILATRILKRTREAPFGIVGGFDQAGERIARTDPDVRNLIGPFRRGRPVA